jgi:hypothetical protein
VTCVTVAAALGVAPWSLHPPGAGADEPVPLDRSPDSWCRHLLNIKHFVELPSLRLDEHLPKDQELVPRQVTEVHLGDVHLREVYL